MSDRMLTRAGRNPQAGSPDPLRTAAQEASAKAGCRRV